MRPDNSINASFLIKDVLIKDIMATILDLARMSDMGDRQFDQFSRSVKDKIYDSFKNTNSLLCSASEIKTSNTDDVLPKVSNVHKS